MRLLLENELVRKMFNAPRTRFRIGESMDRGDVIVIENTQDLLDEDGAAFLGRYFVAQIWRAATARSKKPRDQKKPVFVYIDEAHIVIRSDPMITKIIDECRSQNIGLILAHQRAAQIKEEDVRSALENCAIKMANVDAEAKYFSQLLHIPEERINQLPTGHFAMHVRGEGSSIVKVPLAKPFQNMNLMQRAELQQRMQRQYGIVKTLSLKRPETHKPPQGDTHTTSAQPLRDIPATSARPVRDPSAPTARKPRQ
jgi:hypothetical protein